MKFRTKPIYVDAMQWTGNNFDALLDWRNNFPDNDLQTGRGGFKIDAGKLIVQSGDAFMGANVGDWIVRGMVGNYFPINEDMFKWGYEPCPQKETENA
jgi:hypothetical protein